MIFFTISYKKCSICLAARTSLQNVTTYKGEFEVDFFIESDN